MDKGLGTIIIKPASGGGRSETVFRAEGQNSFESGKGELYVTAFPSATAKWQVSEGGVLPLGGVWCASGNEILYVSADRNMMSVEVHADAPRRSKRSTRSRFSS